MEPLRTLKFQFVYDCAPIWMFGDEFGPWLVSSEGYFVDSLDDPSIKVREERLKGEVELEQKVKLIDEIYLKLWDINEFPDGEPYLGFENEQEKKDFFDACDYVIERMREIFGNEFSVHESTERLVNERSWGCKKAETEKKE